jgi:hypothetical protein
MLSGHELHIKPIRSSLTGLPASHLVSTLTMVLLAHAALAETWAGRPLVDVLSELRSSGIPLIYSSQVVTPDLRVALEPSETQPMDRLREALKPLGLAVKPLGRAGAGFAIVRSESTGTEIATPRAIVNSTQLEEVKVYASRFNVQRDDTTTSVAMGRSALERVTGSEQDALRALHYLPGTANNGVSALTHVRGGNEDETLVQYDGVELYNPVHLKDFQGLFGLLDGEFVQSLQFFSGGFPARYGNHTSGMVDIEARHTQDVNNLLGVSMLYARAISSGSFDHEQGTWLFGYRNSSLPEVLNHLQRKIGDPQFEDFVGRVSYDWHGTKLTAGALRLNDELQLFTVAHAEETVARYHDTYLWLRLERDWNDWLTSRLQFSQANLDAQRQASVNVRLIDNGSLNRTRNSNIYTLLTDWAASLGEGNTLEWGARIDRASLLYAYASQTTSYDPLATTFNVPKNVVVNLAGEPEGDLYSAYVSFRHSHERWTGELGLRWDDYDYIDRAEVFSPRFNLRYELDADSSLRISAGRFVQARTPNNLDITSLAPQLSTPESSEQYILGFERHFDNRMIFLVEAYTKHNSYVRQYSENTFDIVTLAPELKIDRTLIAPQTSYARGIEFSLNSALPGPFNWWANYTWSRITDRISGSDVPRSFDQPHSISAGVAWVSEHWQNSAAITWHTGWPYTPLYVSNMGGDDTAALGPRNSQRFGDFASLDLRTQYQVPLGQTSLQVFLEIRNALNRANDCCRQLSVVEAPDGTLHILDKQKSWLSLVPIAGIDYRF